MELWPTGKLAPGDAGEVRQALESYLEHIRSLLPFPRTRGTDRLMDRYERIERWARHRGISEPSVLMELLEHFNVGHGATQRDWPGGKEQAKAETGSE